MFPRPQPHRAFGILRLAFTLLLATHVFISAWLVATVDGAYTEGKPAPTEAHALVAIDKDQTQIDLRIERATAFFFYTLERDDGASVPVNNSQVGHGASVPVNNSQGGDVADDEGEADNGAQRDWLSFVRNSIKASLVLLVLSELLMLASFRWKHHVRTLVFLFTVVSFALLPVYYAMDLGEGGDNENESTATNTPGANIETVSFVHTNSSTDFQLIWLGIQLEADFSGYDLGLVTPENRTQVAEAVPLNGSADANSFIAFESTFEIQLGENIDALLVLPFMWYLFPAQGVEKIAPPIGGEDE